eukprot:TRINITY_DN1898_c0_g2_i1.p1 TRINITY_DN1898_c0_g2~~TRINITY_DN1898_c0_g2_i1.p1  ORF type:complete len:146 (-),score=12.30 TRINITY_DN1898_c0_g2_i1:409-846(-)
MDAGKRWLAKYGIQKSDIAKGLLIFKGMTWLTWTGMFVFCYRVQPLRRVLLRAGKRYPRVDYYYAKVNERAEQLAKWKFFKMIPEKLGLHSRNFTLTLGENILFYKLTLPITVPIQLGLVWVIIKSKNSFDDAPEDSSAETKLGD